MFTITLTSPSIKKECVYFCINIMHHLAFPSLKSESHKIFFSKKVKGGSMSSFNFGSHMQTLAQTQEMDQLGQEVHELREELTTLRAEVEKLTNLVSSLMATLDQPLCPQQPRQLTPRTQIDLTPMKYAELFTMLLERNLVHTKAPLPVSARLPAGYRADLSCAFHQGALGHDIEQCFALKKIVQKLIRNNVLPFLD